MDKKQPYWAPWDWSEIEQIISEGKHPTDRAIGVAFRGPQPVPQSIRNYLADHLENSWPKGRRTMCHWEKDPRGDLLDASLEVDIVWACCQVSRQIDKGKSIKDAIGDVAIKTEQKADAWRRISASVLGHLFLDFKTNHGPDLSRYSKMSLGDVISQVSKETGVHEESLRNFHNSGSRRKT